MGLDWRAGGFDNWWQMGNGSGDIQIVRLSDFQIVRLSDGEQVNWQTADACDMLLLLTDIDILVIDIELSKVILIVDVPKEKEER